MRRVLVGTIGYHNLRDFSIGPKLLPRLRAIAWPAGVEVDELNWGPIAIVQKFEALSRPYDRLVILTATPRDRPVGTITLFRWGGGLPSNEEIQARISEAVTGVISLDNLLVIGEYFGIWPDEVIVVDVEPGPEEAGDSFSPEIEAGLPMLVATVQRAALKDIETLSPLQKMRGDHLKLAAGIT